MLNNPYFRDKEHYNAFREAWKAALASPKNKNTIEKYEHKKTFIASSGDVVTVSKIIGRRKKGWVTPAHHALYAMLRLKDYRNCFSKLTNDRWYAVSEEYKAISQLCNLFYERSASFSLATPTKPNNFIAKKKLSALDLERIEKFLEPFAGTVTVEMVESAIETHMAYQHM